MVSRILSLVILALAWSVAPSYGQASPSPTSQPAPVTWASLSAEVKAASDKADAVNARIDSVVACGNSGKIYAAGASGADAQGCVEPASTNGVNMTSIVNSLSTLTSNMGSVSNNFNLVNGNIINILNCNRKGQIFDGTNCANASAKVACSLTTSAASVAITEPCPAGYTHTGDMGGSRVCARISCK